MQIARMYDSLFSPVFGGVGLVARVRNTPADRAAWEAFATARNGYPVTITQIPGGADVNDEYIYVILDVSPHTPTILSYVGLAVTFEPDLRHAIYMLESMIRENTTVSDVPLPLFGKALSMTGIGSLSPFGVPGFGSALFTSVFDEDPMQYLLIATNSIDSFTTAVTATSPDVTVTLTDQMGNGYHFGSCADSDAVTRLVSHAFVGTVEAGTQNPDSWKLNIGQCPSYSDEFTTPRRFVFIAAAVLSAVTAIALSVAVWRSADKRLAMALENAHAEERIKAQQLVVGYICHELRNPLHIMRTAFQTVVGELCRVTGKYSLPRQGTGDLAAADDSEESLGSFEREEPAVPTDDEMRSIMFDGRSALSQMQSTVNDVLDYRSLEQGLSSLKLDRQPVQLSKVPSLSIVAHNTADFAV